MLPKGSDSVVMVRGLAPGVPTRIEPDTDAVCAGLSESFTVAVKLNVPLVTGVPEITPEEAVIETPPGNCPDVIDQAYGAVPPVALSRLIYNCVAVAPGNVDEVIVKGNTACGGAATNIEKVAVVVSAGELESLTVTPKLEMPFEVGVPEIIPFEVPSDNPAGS